MFSLTWANEITTILVYMYMDISVMFNTPYKKMFSLISTYVLPINVMNN